MDLTTMSDNGLVEMKKVLNALLDYMEGTGQTGTDRYTRLAAKFEAIRAEMKRRVDGILDGRR